VDLRAVLDSVVKREIPSPRRESNPRIPIVQPVAQLEADRYYSVNYQYSKRKMFLCDMKYIIATTGS
jgi:hypothetical protein